MNMLLRNFFYSVGLLVLLTLYGLDPVHAQFGDLVRLAQSSTAQHGVAVLTIFLIGIDLMFRRTGQTADVWPLKISTDRAGGKAGHWQEVGRAPVDPLRPEFGEKITFEQK